MEATPNPRTPEERHDRRMLAAALFETGKHSQAQIARMLGVSRQAVHVWHQAWTQGGIQALAPGPLGAETLLDPEQERELIALLMQGPGAHGWEDQQWTLARINRLMDERFGRSYADPSGVWRMMDRLGLSWQVPAVRAAERDEEVIAVWRTQVWPRVKRGSAPVRGVGRLR